MSPETAATYPSQYETEITLQDGTAVLLRPIKCDDTEAWLAFIRRLGPNTKYLRFHHVPKEMGMDDALRFCTVDYTDTFAFVAELPREKTPDIIAIGRYVRLPNRRTAEVAFVVEDAHQGKGIGTKLVEWLVNVARQNGIDGFEADVLAENREMMQVFRNYGFHVTTQLEGGIYHVTFPIARTRTVVRREQRRELVSTLAALKAILSPRSVAIIGASRDPASIGHLILQSVIQNGFTGVVYPVNPNAESVLSVKTYSSVLDVPGPVDLAVIVVPAQLVAKVADECGRKGVRALVVISDGFKESGPDGAARELELRAITLGRGMRLVGPNCMGVINTDPSVRLNATFWRDYPQPGGIAFLTQSGAMGLVVLEYANNLNIGISTFVSIGNRADISPTDLLYHWGQDKATNVILLYLESFGDPMRFSRAARTVSATKPIIAVKGGSTLAGSRAALSHTGALATPDIVSDALFHQTGIIRVESVQQLFDAAALLTTQPLPRGRMLAIVTNGGGPGIIAADASARHGLTLPKISAQTSTALKSALRRDISLGNPLDLTAGASADEFEAALKVLAGDRDIDMALAIFVPPIVASPEAMQESIRRVAPLYQRNGKPLVCCFFGQHGMQGKVVGGRRAVPSYLFPEDAVLALAKAVQYSELSKRKGTIPKIRGVQREKGRRLVEQAMAGNAQRPLWLPADTIFTLLGLYGMRALQTVVARSASEAAHVASEIGFPVAVKLNSSTIVHKTDVGAVMLDLKSAGEVEKAFEDIQARLKAVGRDHEMQGVVVQPMITGGMEVIAGVTQDPSFGPLIMFGTGGVYAEVFNDIAVRLHPLTDLDARELIHSVKIARLFEGFRGTPAADTDSVKDLLLRLSALVEDIPQIAELDLNPVRIMARGQGYWIVDSRILVR